MLMVLAAGCSANPQLSPTPLPTLTLIPATQTPIPTPILPTTTPPPRLSPDDLLSTATPTPRDNVAQLLDLALADLLYSLRVEANDVQLVELYTAHWTTPDYGCGDDYVRGVSVDVQGYRMVFRVGDEDVVYHTDSIETVRRCTTARQPEGDFTVFLDVDPVAAELVALAKRRITRDTSIASDDITLDRMRAYTWPDTAWGCPLPDETYVPTVTNGYQIVLSAGAEQWLFHTSFEQLRRCLPENVQLP